MDLWKQIILNSLGPGAVFDAELRYLVCNEPWQALFRLSATEAVGKGHRDLCPTGHRWHEALELSLKGEHTHCDQEEITQPDGTSEHLTWSVAPWRDAAGDICGGIVNAQVISARVSAQRQVSEQNEFERALFERSPIGMNLCRMDGTWLESNPAFLDIIGYTQAEADGKLTYWGLTPRRYDEQEAVQLELLTTTKRYGPYEKEFIRKDGSLVPVRLSGFLIERSNEQFIWSLIEDITSRKALEAENEQERLKTIQASKLAMLGEMAAGVAHEINNPLSIISGYLQVLTQRPASEALIEEGLQAMSAATERARLIVDGMRKIARDDAPGPVQPAVIRDVVEQTLVVYEERLKSHGVELTLDLGCESAALCRPHQLTQVLLNLMTNAFHAIEDAPQASIGIGIEDRPDSVCIQIVDSGPGIPPGQREKIFQPFFTTKVVGRGTGLGLSISKGIVEGFGGELTLERASNPTTFTVTLAKLPT